MVASRPWQGPALMNQKGEGTRTMGLGDEIDLHGKANSSRVQSPVIDTVTPSIATIGGGTPARVLDAPQHPRPQPGDLQSPA